MTRITERQRTAPEQQKIIDSIEHLLSTRNDEVPPDGYDRVDYRTEILLAAYDDDDPEDRTQPVRDLLTDVVHLCRSRGFVIDLLLNSARNMADQEEGDWGPR